MKLTLTFAIITCFFFSGFAQRQQNVYFFKNNGKEVKIRDSADYIRIIRAPEKRKEYYELVEYYPNNTLKRTGKVSSFKDKLILEDTLTSYFKNGVKERVSHYKNNKLVGTYTKFYQSGKPMEVRFYSPTDSLYKIVQIYDEEGNPFLDKDGNGYVKRNVTKTKTEEGIYKNGKRDGLWKEQDSKKKEELEEIYMDGIFQKGISKYEDGSTYTYTVKEQLPQFKGGMPDLYKFLNNNLVYPAIARKSYTQGKVVVSFTIDENGVLNDFETLKSVSSELEAEALRVMSLSPKWEPGFENGRPVKVSYSVPIDFSLPIASSRPKKSLGAEIERLRAKERAERAGMGAWIAPMIETTINESGDP